MTAPALLIPHPQHCNGNQAKVKVSAVSILDFAFMVLFLFSMDLKFKSDLRQCWWSEGHTLTVWIRRIVVYDHEKRHSSLNFKAAQSVLLVLGTFWQIWFNHHPLKEAAFLALGKWLCLDDLNLQHMSHMLGKLFAFEAKKVIARIRKYIRAFLILSFELTVVASINLPKK